MGKWQDEYERHWQKPTREALRARFGRAFMRVDVTTSDVEQLRELLRARGSDFDPRTARGEPFTPTATRHVDARLRRSSVRFQTPLQYDEEESELAYPATQVLTYSQAESDGCRSDASVQSDVSYVYQTPQPKKKPTPEQQRRVRQRSPAAAVSSVERQHKRVSRGHQRPSVARSSTSTFPAFTPRDLNGSHDAARLSASQTLQRRMASMSPITARLRFSVGSALNETQAGEKDESSVLFAMETQMALDAGRESVMTTCTPKPAPLRRRPPTPQERVVDLDVSMQSMHLSEDEGAEGDDDIVMATEDKEDEGERKISAALDFKDLSDDEEEEQKQPPPLTVARQTRAMQWHWSETTLQGESESVGNDSVPEPAASTCFVQDNPPEHEVIAVDDEVIPEPEPDQDDDVTRNDEDGFPETEALTEWAAQQELQANDDPMSTMLKTRLQQAGLSMSEDEDAGRDKDVNPFDSSTASAGKGSPTASSSSASSATTNAKKIYYRTKLPLEVETYNTNVEDRRRERRKKLKKKLASSINNVLRMPECNVDLAPYQREAVQWMIGRETQHPLPDREALSSVSTARQRELYYDRLTSKMRGGILADEMGLGKTVCCIALICESLKRIREELSSEASSADGSSSLDTIPRLKAPTLIITPLSILGQWEKEIREKTNLSVISYQGHTRRQIQNVMDFMGVDVVLSTYDTLRLKECKVRKGPAKNDISDSEDGNDESEDAGQILERMNDSREWHTTSRRLSNSKKAVAGSKLHQLTWHRVILDESHLITNPSCARAKAALFLKSKRRWCVTGTPIQNSGKDLSSLMTFLGMSHVAADLDFHEVLSRVMLRRLKSTVDAESNEPIVQLPDKIEEVKELEFSTDLEKAYYTLLHRSTKRRVFEYLKRQGRGGGGQFMHVFELLLRLRQCCDSSMLVSDDPRGEVQDGNGALLAEIGTLSRDEAALLERASRPSPETSPGYSTKITALMGELVAMKRNNEQGLIVSQWTTFLDLIADAIQDENSRKVSSERDTSVLRFCRLDGRMSAREREQAIASFQVEKRADVMLVSIRTGGLGLNLTAASQVFIMEPSWNPSIESQAIDRAHRVGQKRRVRIVRFLMKHTIEERVVELQRKKRELATATLGDGVASSQAPPKESPLNRDELRELFSQERDDVLAETETFEANDASMEGAIWDEME